jgi:hypothetical protein
VWPSAFSGNNPDIVESTSSEEFGILLGSILSPLLYNVDGAGIYSRLTRGVSILQYADDIVIYASSESSRVFEFGWRFLSNLGLFISAAKSELLLFSLSHHG